MLMVSISCPLPLDDSGRTHAAGTPPWPRVEREQLRSLGYEAVAIIRRLMRECETGG
jgi:hypothetical protein